MTNKEIRDILSLFPDEAQVTIWDEKEDMSGCSFGWYPVNCIRDNNKLDTGEKVIELKHLYRSEIPNQGIVELSRQNLYIVGSDGQVLTNMKTKQK